MTAPFYAFRLSDGRKVELTKAQYLKHLDDAANALPERPVAIHRTNANKLVRSHIELGGHLKKGK